MELYVTISVQKLREVYDLRSVTWREFYAEIRKRMKLTEESPSDPPKQLKRGSS